LFYDFDHFVLSDSVREHACSGRQFLAIRLSLFAGSIAAVDTENEANLLVV
jgi:hypothetical protein